MFREADNRAKFMNQARKSATGRTEKTARPRSKDDERKEALVLLAIAVLFVANVLLYLCHHYGLTSLNDLRPPSQAAPRVIID